MLRSFRNNDRQSAGLAAYMALFCAGYAALTLWYFWADYFVYALDTNIMLIDRAGFMVPTGASDGAWTNLSPWRVLAAVGAVALLGASALATSAQRPHARALCGLTLWGVVLPQSLWFVEFSIDWHGSQLAGLIPMLALGLIAWPTSQLIRPPAGESKVPTPGDFATFGSSLLLAWVAFGATEFLDHSYQLLSNSTYVAALLTVPLAAIAAAGSLTHRLWSIPLGAFAALCAGLIPLGYATSPYLTTGGLSDSLVFAMAGTPANAVMVATLPMVLLAWIWTPALITAAARPANRRLPRF